jgi:GNAT superfamily N-acetyltransferase
MMTIRPAQRSEIPLLLELIEESVRALQRGTYSAAQIELALASVYDIDTILIDDGTYFVIEENALVVACGGWSRRAKRHGGDRDDERADDLLDPRTDAAKIRAFYVRPEHARRGIATRLLEHCQGEARAAGFGRIELGSTLAGVPFYAARGYRQTGRVDVALPEGESLGVVMMERSLTSSSR